METGNTRVNTDVRETILARFRDQVDRANLLLEWAVAAGKPLKPELIGQITRGADLLAQPEIGSSDRAAFETSYNELCRIASPITWETLRATSSANGELTWLAPIRRLAGRRLSLSRTWSRVLWIWTVLLLLLILTGESLRDYRGASLCTAWFSKAVPFLYGALGACASLLRSCHWFMHQRSFDPRRLPEYYNRMLLGFLAGGTILLFVSPESTPQKISATALAFLAGYNSDFLYTTIERVAGALKGRTGQ